jgi:hypothetical protein
LYRFRFRLYVCGLETGCLKVGLRVEGVTPFAGTSQFEVKVRAGARPSVARFGNRISGRNLLTDSKRAATLQVIIDGVQVVVVFEYECVATADTFAFVGDYPVGGCCELCPDWESNVDAVMECATFGYRVDSWTVGAAGVDCVAVRPRFLKLHCYASTGSQA